MNRMIVPATIAILLAMNSGSFAQDAMSPEAAPGADAAMSSVAAAESAATPAEMEDQSTSSGAGSEDSGTMERANEDMQAVLEKLQELGAKPVHTLSVEEARSQPTPADAVMAVLEERGQSTAPEEVASTQDITIPGPEGDIPARVYTPEGEGPFPVIVYFHGGGWVIANIDTYDASARALANEANAIVVSSHYRQGPENKFPAAHEDANAAYEYVVENAGEWNGNTDQLALVGESAGGGLAVSVAIHARDAQLTMPDAIVSVYPIAGGETDTPSYQENANAMPLGKADMEWFFEHYLNSPEERNDPRIDLYDEADLSGLPPTTIINAEIDPLLSDGEMLAEAMEAAGVEVTQQTFEGVTHEFFGMAPVVPEAEEAQNLAGEALQEAWGQAAE
jgi:acetyl esterase